jgi:branched-chain amino acid transport system ATP-binding protein
MSALTIENVTVARGGRPVVQDVSIEVPAGQVTGLLGANGAGKSSLALAISGLLRTASGSIKVDGQEISNKRPDQVRAAGVAVVPEGRRLLPNLTVAENLQVSQFGVPKAKADAGIQSMLTLFPELEKRWDQPAKALSGGEQQMVVLAMALVANPKILVIDELSLGLAPIVVQRLVPTVRDVAAKQGIGVLLIEQFAHVVLGLAMTAYVMEGSKIRYNGTAQELKDNPDLLHSAYLLRS